MKTFEGSDSALIVMKKRYLRTKSSGELETPEEMFWRVARSVAEGAKEYCSDEDIEKLAKKYYNAMVSRYFLPNSPCLMNAGTSVGVLSACFVIPVEDSLDKIFDAIKNAALIHKGGGGTGMSFSRLRPKGDTVGSTSGVSSGPVSFMKIFNAATEQIKAGGRRRGANMGVLSVTHPDIVEFINCKKEEGAISNFNISVAVTNDFMEKVLRNESYSLINPRTGEVVREVLAREIFDLIAEGAHRNGEPGVIFIDRMNRDNVMRKCERIEACNPCQEQPLLAYESCNLASINLSEMVEGETINYRRLKKITETCIEFLDNVITVNRFPIEEVREKTLRTRKVGLGVMGFADMLFKLGIPYDSEDALAVAEKVISSIKQTAEKTSERLADERGVFPDYEKSDFAELGIRRRNAGLLSIAPTGTISVVAGCSAGIEPAFALAFYRKVLEGEKLVEINPIFLEELRKRNLYSEKIVNEIVERGSIQDIKDIPEDMKRVFVTALDISYSWHLKMQSVFQKYVDSAISKTINLPQDATVEDVKKIYLDAWELGLKGVTVYRDKSREEQVLNIGKVDALDRAGKERKRPTVVGGVTRRMRVGCGNLYITINNDDEGPYELFANIGKAGGCVASQTEAIGRLVSLGLRSGIVPQKIIKVLRGIRCHKPFGLGKNKILSCSDAIAIALSKAVEENGGDVQKTNTFVESNSLCPECGMEMVYVEGCAVCRSCGYSECS